MTTENRTKRAGWDCAWTGCTKTVQDEPLERTNPKGQPGEFMCAQHAAQKAAERADR